MHDHVIGELFAVGMCLQGLVRAPTTPHTRPANQQYVDNLDHVISTIRTSIFQLQPRRNDPAGLQTRIWTWPLPAGHVQHGHTSDSVWSPATDHSGASSPGAQHHSKWSRQSSGPHTKITRPTAPLFAKLIDPIDPGCD